MSLTSNVPVTPKPPPPGAPPAPCLILHPNVLVAEDLRDILMSEGAEDVLTLTKFSEADPLTAQLVFVSGSMEAVLQSPQAQVWKEQSVPVILLDADRPRPQSEQDGYVILAEPFRTEDVTALLRKLRVF